jgi:peptide/nickel transport system substrate-binding protein
MKRRDVLKGIGTVLGALPLLPLASRAFAALGELKETPFFADKVVKGELPPLAERLPRSPFIVDLPARGRVVGKPGGEMTTLISRARDIRYLTANAYTRLIGYDEKLKLQPDILERIENEGDKVFTLYLRPGHKWSDGHPFTAEDFRYWWEDIAGNKHISPSGAPEFMAAKGKMPRFEVIDEMTVRYTWENPNPRFLPTLAQPRDPFIYRPAHYLRQFHEKYGDKEKLKEMATKAKLKSWATLHNRLDDMFENTNPALPTLQPWRVMNAAPANRFVFERNPYFHRVDTTGQQLPYVDQVMADIASGGLFAAKSNAGEVDLLARGLSMADIPVLKQGEAAKGYRTLLWRHARGSEVALYPNLTTNDPVWRQLNRDVRYRRALSLAIDRHTLNRALLFGLAKEGNNTISEGSPLFKPEYRTRWATYDPNAASKLLDEVGLSKRGDDDIRLLSDGRPLEIVVEVDGETGLAVDALELITEFWREVGVKLFIKPQERTILRNRAYAGGTVMVATAGLDNALPTALMVPSELAPVRQDNMAWPKWGQYAETRGKSGEAVDMPGGKRLLELYETWLSTAGEAQKTAIWHDMLSLHADQLWSIGTIAGALQPIVVRNGLINLPKEAIYSWDPTSLLGIYRIDEMFWDRQDRRVAEAR